MATALTTLSTLLFIPKCPDGRIDHALRESCRKFCRDTEIWRVKLASFNTVVDQAAYPLSTGVDDTLFIRATLVTVDTAIYPEHRWKLSESGVLTFDPAPKRVQAVVVDAVLVPTLFCDTVADFLVNRWGEYIVAGAEFNLKSDKGSEADPNPFFDPNGAMLARERYFKGVGIAKAEIASDGQSGLKHIVPLGGIWS